MQLIVVKSPDLVDKLLNYSDYKAQQKRDILNGVWYIDYHINENEEIERQGVFDVPSGAQFGWDDVTVITPVYAENKEWLPCPYMLVGRAKADLIIEAAAEEDWEDIAIDDYEVTQAWAESALHEIIHLVIDEKLPYPINECATRYYVRQVFKGKKWQGNYDQSIGMPPTEYWAGLARKRGGDLHRLTFGNLRGERAEELRAWLYQQFTPGVITKIFPDFKWKTKKAPKNKEA